MSIKITLATTARILGQLRHDHRTVGLLVGVPSVLMILLRYVINNPVVFDRFGPMLLGVFPFVVMFVVTSVGTLRERSTGTLERLMTTPMAKLDLLAGYALAFGLTALVQVAVVATISLTWLGLNLTGPLWALLTVAVLDALLGMALGLFASAFARTEFQAVQFMPALVLPQAVLSGLVVSRGQMSAFLHALSDAMPMSYAVEAMQQVTIYPAVTGTLRRDLAIIAGCTLLSLGMGAATLRRRTP
ncbi:MAG TPA: ABC transporter permease [Streptosporangiaceae bacterium]|nr:ABC transporter permease [Streptosporangiaceae bacterium]